MTTRTLTVQADRRAYVPHVVCVVKIVCSVVKKTVLSGLCNTRLGRDLMTSSYIIFAPLSLFTIWEH